MKLLNTLLLFVAMLGFSSCCSEELTLVVSNTSTIDREGAVVEVCCMENPSDYIVLNEEGYEVPSQVTYDGKLLVMATVKAGAEQTFKLSKEQSRVQNPVVYTTGRIFPERIDDIAWENDKIGYRVYSKKAGADGWKLWGYDIFTKIGSRPILDDIYAAENDLHDRALVIELEKRDPKGAQTMYDAISYHINHGQGMDYYPVGQTLGCGTTAIVTDGEINYPEYFRDYEILDNGPLRFTVKLVFDAVEIAGDQVIEERLVTLDAGSHFNKIKVEYKNISEPRNVIIGLVMHDSDAESSQVRDISIAYAEPAHKFGWQTYIAAVFPETMKARVAPFSAGEAASRGATGHVQAEGVIKPGESLEYYMGAAWNRWCIKDTQDWFAHVRDAEIVLNQPLTYTLSK